MKTTLTILTIAAIVAFGNTSYAQESPEQRVKILPTNQTGVIRLLYAMQFDEPLKVTFLNAQREVLVNDKIYGIDAPNGISKRYDVSKIGTDDFFVEISSSKHVLIYHVTGGSDRKKFSAELEPTSYQFLVRADN